MFCQTIVKGLGQLEAYTEMQEGVAFQMDNGMFWNSVVDNEHFPVQATDQKTDTSKFFIKVTNLGKVALRDWQGLYLAPKPLGVCETIYPLHPMHRRPKEESEFKVFHQDNLIAFQAHNGRFLTKVFRGVYIVEASKTNPDSSCLFEPQIGDLLRPHFDVISVAIGDLSKLKFRLCVLKKETRINRSREPVRHKISLTWFEDGTQTTAWTHRWGLGVVTMADFPVLDSKVTLKYNEDNDKVVSMPRIIYETLSKELVLPPRSKAIARLVVYKQNNAAVLFMAKIQKLRPDGIVLNAMEPGVWNGLVYYDLKMEVRVEPLMVPCETM